MAEKLLKLPFELQLALRTIVNSEASRPGISGHLENQELIFILYPDKKLTWEEIKEEATIPAFDENALRECIDGLWVTGFYEGGFEDHQKFYELTPFGRRLLKGMLDALYIVEAVS